MIAYKFLRRGGVGPFTAFRWPLPRAGEPGTWVSAAGGARLCLSGVHACRAEDLPRWLSDELWRIELGGTVTAGEHKLVAASGRILEREQWSPDVAEEMARACAWRACDHAVGVLSGSGAMAEATELSEVDDLGELQALGAALAERRPGPVGTAAGYAADAAEAARRRAAAPAALAAARAGAHARGSPRGLDAEREWQAGWLRERLGLE